MKKLLIIICLLSVNFSYGQSISSIASNGLSTIDANAPTLNISTVFISPVSVPITATITASKPVTGFIVGDITTSNCTLSSFAAVSGNVYTVVVTPIVDGTFTISVAATKCVDVRGTSNTASNTLSLSYASGGFLPSSASPDLWLDMIYAYGYTNSYDNLNKIVDVVTTRDATAYPSAPLSGGLLYKKPSWNGEGYFFNSYAGFTLGAVADFKNLHGSSGYTLYYQWKQLPTTVQTSVYPIFNTNNGAASNANIGVKLSYVNSATNPATIKYTIYNGAGGSPPFDLTCSNSSVSISDVYGQGGLNTLKITFTGTVLTIYIKNAIYTTYTSIGTLTVGSPSLSSANATGLLQIGADGFLSGNLCYGRHLIFYQSSVSGGNITSTETYLTAQESTVITPTIAKVFLGANLQSNGEGQGENTGAVSALQAPNLLGSFRYRPYANEVTYSNAEPYWGQLQLSTHAKAGVPPLTQHGWYARLGLNMAADGYPLYMIFPCRSSTPIKKSTVSNNWSATTPYDVFSYFNSTWKQGIQDGLYELIHVMRKTPELRHLYAYQGESDAGSITQTQYRDEQEALVNAMLDYIVTLGYDVSKIWFVNTLVTSGTNTLTSVAISNSAGDALFTKTAHGITNGQWAKISGSIDYDGVRYISVIDANTFKVRTTAAGSNVAYVAVRTATVKNYGDVNSGKLEMYDSYFTRFPLRVGTFKGNMYADAASLSSATHLDAVQYDQLGVIIEGLILPHINE